MRMPGLYVEPSIAYISDTAILFCITQYADKPLFML